MPKIVAIDTTGEICSLALYSDTDVWRFHQALPRQHARQILPQLDRLFAEAGWAKTDIDYVVYGRGPGSFTGIRIAAGVAQGIALGADCGVVPVSTLQTLAHQAQAEGAAEVWVALDARMQELYFARYRTDSRGWPVLLDDEQLLPPSELPGPQEGIALVGNGWRTGYDFPPSWSPMLAAADVRLDLPKAEWGARLAAALVRGAEVRPMAPEHALPIYLRDNVTWKQKPKVGS